MFGAARLFVRTTIDDWQSIRIADLHFWHRSDARLVVIGLIAATVVLLVVRSMMARRPGRQSLVARCDPPEDLSHRIPPDPEPAVPHP